MAEQINAARTILRRKEVEQRTGLHTSSLYAQMSRGEFPRPVKIAAKAVGWRSDEVDAWIDSREKVAA